MSVVLNTKHVNKFMDAAELSTIFPQVKLAHELLESRQGPGNEFLGWMDLPVAYDKAEFARIKQAAAKICSDSEVLVVIGIGGS
ncbi:MAG: glucose-6-phosphate isomerase, partial [Ruthenibacterium sp.]